MRRRLYGGARLSVFLLMGVSPIFRFWRMNLHELVEKTVEGLGFEAVDIEMSPRGRLLRVFIDRLDGKAVDVEDCATVSNQLTRLFEVEQVDYDRLEVSSPGLDRVLTKPEHFVRFAGCDVQLRTRLPEAGSRRNFSGRLEGLADGKLTLTVDGQVVVIEFSNVERTRLVPKF